jgi:hypothetical protein
MSPPASPRKEWTINPSERTGGELVGGIAVKRLRGSSGASDPMARGPMREPRAAIDASGKGPDRKRGPRCG